jgi:hypothetical protein
MARVDTHHSPSRSLQFESQIAMGSAMARKLKMNAKGHHNFDLDQGWRGKTSGLG